MLRSLLIAAVLCCGCITVLNAQSFFTTHYVDPGETSDAVTHITTQDGGNLIASVQHPAMSANYFITLFKADGGGVIQWTKKFPTVQPGFKNIVQSSDGTYFLCYAQFPFGNHFEAVRLDANGNVLFDKKISLPPLYRVTWKTSVVAKSDSGYYVGCSLFDTTTSMYQWNLMELSPGGNVTWSKHYNAGGFLGALSGMELCSNGDVLLLGSTYDLPTQSYAGLITRVAPNGNEVWSTRFGNSGHDLFPVDAKELGTDFIVSIQDYQQSAGIAAVDFMKISGNGTPVWEMRYTNTNPNSSLLPYDLIVSGGNEYTVVAQRSGPQLGSVFLKVDGSGQYLGSRFYPSYTITSIENYGQWMYSLTGTKDSMNSHFIALKTVDGNGIGCNDTTAVFGMGPAAFAITITTGATGVNLPLVAVNGNLSTVAPNLVPHDDCIPAGIMEGVRPAAGISLYPVPADEQLFVTSATTIATVELLDVKGAVVYTQPVNALSATVETKNIPNGVYFVRTTGQAGVHTAKVVIAR